MKLKLSTTYDQWYDLIKILDSSKPSKKNLSVDRQTVYNILNDQRLLIAELKKFESNFEYDIPK